MTYWYGYSLFRVTYVYATTDGQNELGVIPVEESVFASGKDFHRHPPSHTHSIPH